MNDAGTGEMTSCSATIQLQLEAGLSSASCLVYRESNDGRRQSCRFGPQERSFGVSSPSSPPSCLPEAPEHDTGPRGLDRVDVTLSVCGDGSLRYAFRDP